MEHSYFIRVTPREPMTLNDLLDVFEKLQVKKYFLCIEEASRVHFHACIWTPRSSENLRYQLKLRISGQVYISGKEIEDKIKAISYCMKDGSYVHKEINIHDLLTAKANTFKKETFDGDLKLVKDRSENMSLRQLVSAIVDLYIKHLRKIYILHIRSLVDLLLASRSSSYKDLLVDKIIGDS